MTSHPNHSDKAFEDAHAVAKLFHETYERLAPEYGYKTNDETAVDWKVVPHNNKRLMVATAAVILEAHQEAVRERVIEELKHIDGGRGQYWWGSQKRDIAMTVEERIAELKGEQDVPRN